MKPLLLLMAGHAHPSVRKHLGDFDVWFERGLARPVQVLDLTKKPVLPPARSLAGVVISGSAARVSHREDWSEAAADWLRALPPQLPVLGVCYGSQLLAHAQGGRVGPNPAGRQIGSRTLRLTAQGKADGLLETLPTTIAVQTTHLERVLEPPPGAVVLATTERDPCHALRLGPARWGLQFHPEFDRRIMGAYLEALRTPCAEEGIDVDAEQRRLADSSEAAGLLGRFARLATGVQV